MTPYFFGKPQGKCSFGAMFIVFLFLSLGLSACNDTSGSAPSNQTESFTFGGTLYVTNSDGSLLAFDPLSTNRVGKAVFDPIVQDENISPSRRFPEAVTGPTGLFFDRATNAQTGQPNDTLYVANTGQNAISIYEGVSALTAPFPATRVISGSNTLLDQPFGVTFDAAHHRIFVANTRSNTVLVFEKGCAGATSLAGNIHPCRILMGTEDPASAAPALFPLDMPRALAFDATRDILYISNMGNDSIFVYENAGSLGGDPTKCVTDFTICNQPPSRTITPHTSSDRAKQISKLELPFGLFIDSGNDRLYVVNTGLNTPGILIYENASAKNGPLEPERVIAGINSPTANPPVKNLTQLTIPSGIDVDVSTGQLYILNNNSPNNVNQSSGNTDSPTLIIFNDINTSCPIGAQIPCNIAPNRRIGGDINTTIDTDGKFVFDPTVSTLSSPTGIAFDPVTGNIYVTNTGANNFFVFSSLTAVSGDVAPIKVNAGITKLPGQNFDNTSLEEPGEVHYDAALDRLYVTNFSGDALAEPVLVYDQVSTLNFNESPPSWSITGDANFKVMRGFHVDKKRGFLLVLNASLTFGSKFSIYCIPNDLGVFNATCLAAPTTSRDWTTFPNIPATFPTNTANGPSGLQLVPPTAALFTISADVSPGGPAAMEVDEASGDVYIADKNLNSIFVYNLQDNPIALKPNRTITGGLLDPNGLSYDATRDILYVTNAGDDSLVAFDGISTKTNTPGTITPDRSLKTPTLPPEDQLLTPLSPQIDPLTNRLALINSGKKAIFIYELADQLDGEVSPDKRIAGATTLFDFAVPTNLARTLGGLFILEQDGSQTVFVGQAASPLCPRDIAGNIINAATCPPGALLIFGADGKIVPGAVAKGGVGVFTTPTDVAVDTQRNVLYVTNQSTDTLSILKNADELDVAVKSSAGKTNLNNIQLNAPTALFMDIDQNRLYILNSGTNEILAFNTPDALAGGETPSLKITDTRLNAPRGITLDTGRKRLYVANTGDNSILSFSLEGAPSLDFVLSGSETRLASPIAVAINPSVKGDPGRDDLYVLNNAATEVLVFEHISTRNGNVAPSRIITGSDADGKNFMTRASALFIDSEKDLLYVSDIGSNAIYFFINASTAQGQAEHSALAGDNTGLKQPTALFVDTTSTGSP